MKRLLFAALALTCLSQWACKTDVEFSGSPDRRKLNPKPPLTDVLDPTPGPAALPDPIKEIPLNPEATDLGPKPREVVENFVQESIKNSADILIVIDDSQSMREEQKNLSSKMNALLKSLVATDWKIGVISTTAVPKGNDYACDLDLIHSTDIDAVEAFSKAVQAGTGGSGNEQGILQAVVGIRCLEKPWVRPDSSLAVLIVSDEDNCSNGQDCARFPAKSEVYLTDYVEKTLGRMVGINAGFYGIYSPPSKPCSSASATANIYQRLIDYRMPNSKNFGSICDSSYQETLERISGSIAELLKNTLELKDAPIVGSVKIEATKANGQAISNADFSVSGKVVGFKVGSEPRKGSKIVVRYQLPGEL